MQLNSPVNRLSILAAITACSLLACGGSSNNSNDGDTNSDSTGLTTTLSASPEVIFAGDSSLLSWTSTGADRCTGHGFQANSATSGTANVAPSQTALYTVTCTDNGATNTARSSATVAVTSSASAPNLLQAAYQSTSASYVFGFNSIPSIPIAGAPADTDFSRMAMLHDGSNYRLYALKANSDSQLYGFVFDASNSRYVYQPGDAARITGTPADADFNSFAMSGDSATSRLYMRSQSQPSLLHRFSRNPASGDFEYGFQTPSTVSVINTSLDSDFTRWAVLFDNNTERLYLGQSGNIDTLYPFAFNGNSGAFEYALNSAAALPITGTPANSDTIRFSMLHDGNDYRFYHPTADGTAPTDPTDIRPYMLSAYSCLQRQDANHFLFHGCFDWHSSVHAHWAVLRYGNLVERSSEVDDVVARLQSAALDQERMALNTATNFETNP